VYERDLRWPCSEFNRVLVSVSLFSAETASLYLPAARSFQVNLLAFPFRLDNSASSRSRWSGAKDAEYRLRRGNLTAIVVAPQPPIATTRTKSRPPVLDIDPETGRFSKFEFRKPPRLPTLALPNWPLVQLLSAPLQVRAITCTRYLRQKFGHGSRRLSFSLVRNLSITTPVATRQSIFSLGPHRHRARP
jgi:hypothetical protein